MSFGSFIDRLPGLGSRESTAADSVPAVDDSIVHVASGAGGWVSAFLGLLGFGQSASSPGYDHGHGGSHYWGMEDMLQLRRTLFWMAAVVVVLLIAAITNPTEASFRSHLTELSFRRHLADIRHSSTDTDDDASTSEPGLPTLSAQAPSGTLLTVSGTDTPPIAPFRFANHVSISLRTPPLYYKTLFFLSFALTSPLAPPIYLSDPPIGKKAPLPPRERSVLYIGYLGHWVVVGTVPRKVEWVWRLFTEGGKEKGKRKNALLDRSGITELRSIAGKEDGIGSRALVSATAPILSATKNIRKSDSVSNLAENGTLPLHAHPAPIPVAPFVVESRRSSIVNLLPNQPTSAHEVFDAASSPLLTALKADLTAAQSALSEVKSQLHALEESVSTAHSSLQTSLDEVRSRRKEDDGERQELKSRTKALEEQKRQAEAARREAEKKLKAIEGLRDGLESKIQAALNEIQDFKGLVEVSTRAVRTVQEEGAKFLIETRDNVERRREELEEVEGDIGELDARNEELGRAIQEAEEKVEEAKRAGEEAKKLGPEEEMMMMAAAYEAAAQEGYGHASQHPGASHGGPGQGHAQAHGSHGNHGHAFGNRNVNGNNGGNNNNNNSDQQWAHQAAQYMAEAGMPHIDQNYSARPSHSTSFGQFARPHKAVEERRPADLIGFEDFGPGALGAALGGMGGQRQTTTPPASDSGSDVWGHDPGSPNGGISSSFSANLLPQGLFRSLEGDTPLDANTEVDEESMVGAMDDEHEHERDDIGFEMDLGAPEDAALEHGTEDDGSDSGSSNSFHGADIEPDQSIWRSPLPAPNALPYPVHANSAHQLLPPSSRTPPSGSNPAHQHSAPSLPGLPALPGSRRWYSGTTSSSQENVNVFGISPSNDSLLQAAYESSPFAPSSSERQQLALKWGSLGRRWGKDHAGQAAAIQAHGQGQGQGQSVTRSFSADLGAGWLPSRLRRDDLAHDVQDAHGAHDEHDRDKDGKDANALAPERASGEKKPFRFFSLRRPTSSGSASVGERTGTSPARE